MERLEHYDQQMSAEMVYALAQVGAEAAEALRHPLGRMYVQVLEDGDPASLQYKIKTMIGAEDPFERIAQTAGSVAYGNTGWSAEIDGMRIPEALHHQMEYNDFLYYIPFVAAGLEECYGQTRETAEFLDFKDVLDEVVAKMDFAMLPLYHRFGGPVDDEWAAELESEGGLDSWREEFEAMEIPEI